MSNCNIVEYLGYLAALVITFKLSVLMMSLLRRFILSRPLKVASLGEWALVTGSTDGIGKAYAMELARKGLNVVLVSRSDAKLKTVAKEIEERHKVKTLTVVIDFAQENYSERLAAAIEKLEIGVLVNNVGMSVDFPMPFLSMEPDAPVLTERLVNVNIRSLNVVTRVILPGMVKRGKGAIVNVGSLAADIPSPMYAVYAACKAYVSKISESLDLEYSSQGIVVQCVNPGPVVSNMTKLRRSSLLAPYPEAFVKSALSRLGVDSETHGYWTHDLLGWVINLLPEMVANKLLIDYTIQIRNRALKKKKAKEQ